VRDVSRITFYTIGRIFHYGSVVGSYRRALAAPTIVDDTRDGGSINH